MNGIRTQDANYMRILAEDYFDEMGQRLVKYYFLKFWNELTRREMEANGQSVEDDNWRTRLTTELEEERNKTN